MKRNFETIIDYYEGSYGPTLRIDMQMLEGLLLFKNSIKQLMDEKIHYIDFLNVENVRVTANIASFKLFKTHKHVNRSIFKSYDKNNSLVFSWYLSSDQLFHLLGLIDGLLIDENSGHQYLTHECEEVLIELAYKE